MKFGVITFPGSNCDADLLYVLKNLLRQNVVNLWHKDHDLQGCDFIFIPGGFSYGDYLRTGAIARFSPIMTEVVKFANNGGYVMGICNGFQILTEAGLLPGVLLSNRSTLFISDNVYLKSAGSDKAPTRKINGEALKIPIAHGDGNFYCDADTLKEIQDNNQILFQYCNANGVVSDEFNPNGSLLNIAGVCNKTKNVFAMMPHPERAADAFLGNTDGLKIFDSILA